MKILDLIPLFGAILNFGLAIFVLSHDRKSRLNQIFFICSICIAIWNLGTFALFRIPPPPPGGSPPANAYHWARFLQCGVIFIPVTLLHLSLLISRIALPRLLIGLYGLGVVLFITNLFGWFISGVRFVGYAYYSIAGPGFWIFALNFWLTIAAIIVLLRERRKMAPLHRKRLTGLIMAQALLVVLGGNDILPILNIDRYPFTEVAIFPYGSLAAGFYGIIVAYSVLQHQFLDVHVALGRVAAHVIRFLFVFVIGLGLQLLVTLFAPPGYGTFAFISSLAVLIVSTIIASIFFPRLLGSSSEGLERRLLGDRFEYQDQVRNFIEGMTWYSDLNLLLNDVHELFVRTFHIANYQIILRNESTRVFEQFRVFPEATLRQLPEFKTQSPIFQYFEWQKAEYLSLKSTFLRPGESPLEKQSRQLLAEFKADFCFPLLTENEPFGLLLVGQKSSAEPYTATDIGLLVALVKSLSLMVNQIRLKTQILQAQELDLLGRMSRGMAHDLNNLLTPIWTLLQLASEGMKEQALDDELLPVALRNIKTMRAYIKESLFFSENLRPDIQLGRLDMMVQHAIEVAKNSRKKPVEVVAETPGEVTAELDEVLIQRLIANIISNAIDASHPGGQVRVELLRLVQTESSRDWLRVRIIDQGEGIRKEDLNRVFTPYFTTKNRGDEGRGFGLGLAICRKIVNLHGGNLSIASQPKKGTTVQIDLPSRQIKPVTPAVAHAA